MKINIDKVGISETWLSQTTSDNLISIDGYTLFRRDRADGRRGGGLCIYVKNTLSCIERYDLSDTSLEAIWIKLVNVTLIWEIIIVLPIQTTWLEYWVL